jgi:predicted Zn-dependent protease
MGQAAPLSQNSRPTAKNSNAVPSFADYCRQSKNNAVLPHCLEAAKQYEGGNVALALTLMHKAVKLSASDGHLRMLLGYTLLRGGNAGPAERELRQARKDGAPDEAVLPPLLRAMVARHDENRLLEEFSEPTSNAKGNVPAQILHGRAQALFSLDRLDEAAAEMDKSLALQKAPAALRDRANIALKQKDPAKAEKFIDAALQLDPNNGPALVAKLQLIEKAAKPANALAFSERILKIYPNNIDARTIRIRAFLKLNQDGKAKNEVDAVLARSPRQPIGLFYRAVLMSRAKDNRGAFQLLQSLPTGFERAYPDLSLTMAQIAFANGNVERGAAILGGAISADPDLLDARLRLVELRMSQDSPRSAMLLLGPVKDSSDPRVKKLLGQVQRAVAKDRAF